MDELLSKGTVKTWHRDEGWGSIRIEGMAEECFVHFSCIGTLDADS
jgi:cold shock CspA family protein